MKLLVGVVIGLLFPVAAFLVVLALGAYDMSATRPPGLVERIVGGVLADRSIARRAPNTKNPVPPTAEVLRAGLEHYREMCVMCHGAPGIPPGEVGKGLNPPPPNLASADAQEGSDGELFEVIARGVRMTGMPAWSRTHSDEQIWQMVAFVRHLPALSPGERALLREGAGGEAHRPAPDHHDQHQHEPGHPAGAASH